MMHRKLFNTVVFAGFIFISLTLLEKPLSAQTQFEISKMFSKEFAVADSELTKVYNKIMREYKGDREFIEKMKIAQRAWIKFRDAHMDSLFPAKDKQSEYGSSFEMCFSAFITKLTQERIEQLKPWIRGVEEGEVCTGSIKTKNARHNN